MLLFYLEISDKVIPVPVLYGIYVALGVVGFGLGLWRWWAALLWLFVPMFLIMFLLGVLQYDEITYLYDDIVRELGNSYLTHSFVAPIVGVTLNLLGIVTGIGRRNNNRWKLEI